ncbi:MAG TPA: thymidylate synthase [Candidatus Paceibacterota bacterium]|nr:thymidylate synthase [Candidatus Paceibacterota bacterium]
MKQYLELLQNILDNGVEKESGRANMPNTIEISKGDISMDLSKGFPLLTTKRMFWKGIVHELLWFLRGETNIKYLVDNNVNIWNGDGYRWYLKKYHDRSSGDELSMDEFIELIKNPYCDDKPELPYWTENSGERYTLGDLGKVYGYQWRNQNGVDQIADIIKDLKENPYGRYKILDAWNKSDFRDMALPPCHLLYHFIVRPISNIERNEWYRNHGPIHTNRFDPDYLFDKAFLDVQGVPKFYLDLNMYQRSCDTFLGVPFNIASMSLLLMIIAKTVNMIPGVANWIGGHTHLYVDHIPVVKEQTSRTPLDLPKMKINRELNSLDDILELTIDDFQLEEYEYHPSLKAELFTGLKK